MKTSTLFRAYQEAQRKKAAYQSSLIGVFSSQKEFSEHTLKFKKYSDYCQILEHRILARLEARND